MYTACQEKIYSLAIVESINLSWLRKKGKDIAQLTGSNLWGNEWGRSTVGTSGTFIAPQLLLLLKQKYSWLKITINRCFYDSMHTACLQTRVTHQDRPFVRFCVQVITALPALYLNHVHFVLFWCCVGSGVLLFIMVWKWLINLC